MNEFRKVDRINNLPPDKEIIMKKIRIGCLPEIAMVLLFVATFLLSAGTVAGAQSLKVITTLFPLQEFARAVGGEYVQAEMIIPPGFEPHAWEPKPSDLAKITRADVFVFVGPSMEPWVSPLLKAARGSELKVVEAGVGLLRHDTKGSQPGSAGHDHPKNADPHLWLDFALDQKIVDSISATFSEKDPANASRFRANADVYNSKLDALDKKFRSALSTCRGKEIVLGGHSAFSYLARRYGLQQVPLYGINPNSEPTPKKMAEVIQSARRNGVKYIFFEELVNPKLAQVLAKEGNLQTLVLNDGANLSREKMKQKITFLMLMEQNLENLRRGLDCG